MLRRKPTKIEVKIKDKEELEEGHHCNNTTATTTTTTAAVAATALLHQFDGAEDPSSKAHRINLSS